MRPIRRRARPGTTTARVSAIIESLAAVFLRNFHQAYVSAKAQGLPDGYYYPLVHCGTSFGNYKEVRGYLLHSAKLRERVKKILGKLGRLVDGKLLIPEEVVHYSEWLHVMRDEIAKRQVIDCRATSARRFTRPATSTRWFPRTRFTTTTRWAAIASQLQPVCSEAGHAGHRLPDLV